MRRRDAVLLAFYMLIACLAFVAVRGDRYTLRFDVGAELDDLSEVEFAAGGAENVLALAGARVTDGVLELDFQALGRGRMQYHLEGPGDFCRDFCFYVHYLDIITYDNYFGNCSGSRIIPSAIEAWLICMLAALLKKYRTEVKKDRYRYANLMRLGLIIYLFFLAVAQLQHVFVYEGLIQTIYDVLYSAGRFARLALPVAFVLSVLVTISNISLMKAEGRNWRNMLGFLQGLFLCGGTLLPSLMGDLLKRVRFTEEESLQGILLYLGITVENAIYAMVAYMECILIGTILFGIRSALQSPALDKDYIIILGCRIRKDGSLTPLLKGRAQRALEFAGRQERMGGKAPIFVPSGGKGADEPVSEAHAVEAYLRSCGIAQERILPEEESVSTYENIRNSMRLIRSHGGKDAKAIFSTTNYHVFRAGLIASEQGEKLEGIGSSTRSYFWINAFVREFIATLYSQRKRHFRILALLWILTAGSVLVVYYSNIL